MASLTWPSSHRTSALVSAIYRRVTIQQCTARSSTVGFSTSASSAVFSAVSISPSFK